jgi:hypothetical protein
MSKLEVPHNVEFRGPCGPNDRYELSITTIGPLTVRHVRNIIKQMELTAMFLTEDDEPGETPANG